MPLAGAEICLRSGMLTGLFMRFFGSFPVWFVLFLSALGREQLFYRFFQPDPVDHHISAAGFAHHAHIRAHAENSENAPSARVWLFELDPVIELYFDDGRHR